MSEWEVALGALVLGLAGGAIWSRWRNRVVGELRKIRELLERVLKRDE